MLTLGLVVLVVVTDSIMVDSDLVTWHPIQFKLMERNPSLASWLGCGSSGKNWEEIDLICTLHTFVFEVKTKSHYYSGSSFL